MKKLERSYSRVLVFAMLFLLSSVGTIAGPFPRNVHRIVFIGNSITYDGKYVVDIESYFITHYPDTHFEFINAGLPSETVSGLSEEGHADGRFPRPDLHERLARVLAQTKPDLVFASYGMNDGIYLPFDEQRFQKFKDGITWLHDEVIKYGAKIIHLTPPVYDETTGSNKGYAAVLDRYSEWLLEQSKKQKWQVADIHFAMKNILEQERKANPSFTLARDGVHPGEEGHWIMAKQILLFLGEKKITDRASTLTPDANANAILALVTKKQDIMKDAWLTATKHTRPEMNTGLPLNEAKAKAADIDKQINALLNTRKRS
ncbi:MAG: SGNH/GDSL hydrolase family protein [Agriterribacter sp.]